MLQHIHLQSFVIAKHPPVRSWEVFEIVEVLKPPGGRFVYFQVFKADDIDPDAVQLDSFILAKMQKVGPPMKSTVACTNPVLRPVAVVPAVFLYAAPVHAADPEQMPLFVAGEGAEQVT